MILVLVEKRAGKRPRIRWLAQRVEADGVELRGL